ncbi:MAG: lysine-sensitive aspartokinase 3 [Acidobacteria bacterium]|nr:MAG: lysine-sensitive aspartokinase 3 [Acidobacteriota bacterium]PYY22873.1 MAG: lysine-sensitive aspartokinase 3 [Acidobacteriota bacterium]
MLVMKFGGTSVACAENIARIARIVRERLHLQPVVVVSALAGVTDGLQRMGALSRDGEVEEALSLLQVCEDRHCEAARALLSNKSEAFLQNDLRPLFDEAGALLKAVFAVQELTPRTLDRLLGFGERWSSRLVAEAFRAEGLRAVHVNACDVVITDANYSHAAPLVDLIRARVATKIRPRVQSGCVPVLGGFIGSTEDGIPTTLGRGGSDYTASILGASIDADSIEIWTDVDGMMTADPRICPDAQNIESISFDEAAELAHFGAKVLHPKTLQPAVNRGIPVYVLNSRHPENCGTRVEVAEPSEEGRVRSVACKRGITLAEVFARQGLEAKLTSAIFDALERQKCLVDLAAMSRSNLSLLLNSRSSADALCEFLEDKASVNVVDGSALVSLVGRNVARNPAICARALNALPDLPLRMIFHGASDMNLSFVVAEEDADKVVRCLHAALFPRQPAARQAEAQVPPNKSQEPALVQAEA